MENLLDLANRLLSDARQALKSLKKNPEKARSYLQTIRALSEEELSVVLSTFQLGQEEKAYYFNTQEKTKAIAQAAQAAAKALEEGRTKETKKFLEMIISLENTLIKQEKTRKLEIIAVSKATAEAAVLLLLRTYADPYLQYMGKQIDIIDYKISHLDELLKEKLKEQKEDIKTRIKKFFGREERPAEEKKELQQETEQLYKHYTSLEEHPVWVPHMKKDEPYAHLFSDAFYLTILVIIAGRTLIKHLPSYIGKKLEQRRVERTFFRLSTQFKRRILIMQEHLRAQAALNQTLIGHLTLLEEALTILAATAPEQTRQQLRETLKKLKDQRALREEETKKLLTEEAKTLGEQLASETQQLIKRK